jgi:ELWxxDGT repeat protein
LGEILIFAADDGVHGREPWRTDGTPDGTYLLGDLTPGAASSLLSAIGVLRGDFYFGASDGTTSSLWKTDGTAAGTVAVTANPAIYAAGVEMGGALYFSANDTTHGTELWRTDGTAAGTGLFLDINPTGDSSPYVAGRLGDRLVFWADDGTHGFEPWTTDGTVAGTSILGDLDPGPARSGPGSLTFLGSTLFFFAHDGVHGFEPWKSDGTPAGTVLVRDVVPGPAGSYSWNALAAMGHEALFTASDRVSGGEFWRTDGTEAGTSRVADLNPGIASGTPHWSFGAGRMPPVRSGGRMFFAATDGTTGYELWSIPIPLGFHTVTPCRVADTRDPAGPAGGVPLGASETLILPVTGHCGIPSTAISVAANVTVVNPTATGTLSVFAGGTIVSGTTEVPVTAGKTRALNAIPILGTAGSLTVRAALPLGGSTDILLDVSGWFE